jgi:hypothetical protein
VKSKVFCIGSHKTGTTSLEIALKKLGYRVRGSFGTKDPDIANKVHQMAYAMVEKYDAFEDNPWPVLFKELDRRFPGSKFILTRRPADAWIRSMVKDFATTETPMRRWIYGEDAGCPEGNEDVYIARYDTSATTGRCSSTSRKDPTTFSCSTCPAATAGTSYARSSGTKFRTNRSRTPTRRAGHEN